MSSRRFPSGSLKWKLVPATCAPDCSAWAKLDRDVQRLQVVDSPLTRLATGETHQGWPRTCRNAPSYTTRRDVSPALGLLVYSRTGARTPVRHRNESARLGGTP